MLSTGFSVLLFTLTGCSAATPGKGAETTATTTTKIAGAGVLGNQRRPDESCAPEPARPDSTPATRSVRNADGMQPGSVEVPGDPQRIVALAGDQLDALCALGLQGRAVGAALADGADQQPAYLGRVVHDLPGVGSRSTPDPTAIEATHPDLILGEQGSAEQLAPQLAKIAPTVFTVAPAGDWQDSLRAVGAATGRGDAADELITKFGERAAEAGTSYDAVHYQVSVLQLTGDKLRVFGAIGFAPSVLRAVGTGRPAGQRFTDQPYREIDTTDLATADFSAADADIVYLSLAGAAAKARVETVLNSPAWKRLSAAHDNRVFIVNNEIWQTGQGLVAARGIIDDLRFLNAPIN